MCRVINFTKGHFYTLLRIIVSSVFLESRRRRLRRRRRQTKKKVIAHHYTRGGGGRATLSRSKPLVLKAFPKALFNNECVLCRLERSM